MFIEGSIFKRWNLIKYLGFLEHRQFLYNLTIFWELFSLSSAFKIEIICSITYARLIIACYVTATFVFYRVSFTKTPWKGITSDCDVFPRSHSCELKFGRVDSAKQRDVLATNLPSPRAEAGLRGRAALTGTKLPHSYPTGCKCNSFAFSHRFSDSRYYGRFIVKC